MNIPSWVVIYVETRNGDLQSLVSDTRCLCHFHELMLRGASLYQATIRSGLLLSRLVASPAPEVLSESLMRRCFLSTGSARLSDQIFDQKQRNDSETHALNAYKHMSPVLNPWCSPPLLPSVGFTPESKECNENASSFLQDQLVASVHAMRRGHRLLWINGGSGGDGNLKAFTLALLHWTLSRFPTVPFTQLLRRQAFGYRAIHSSCTNAHMLFSSCSRYKSCIITEVKHYLYIFADHICLC